MNIMNLSSSYGVLTSKLTVLMLVLMWGTVQAAKPVYTGHFSNTAAGGYDVVSYFNAESPLKGKKQYTVTYQGANWHFINEANKSSFAQSPEKFAPQYGGYCAYAIAFNDTAKGNPEYWDLHEGKLYFSLNRKYQNLWMGNKDEYIFTADGFWPEMIAE